MVKAVVNGNVRLLKKKVVPSVVLRVGQANKYKHTPHKADEAAAICSTAQHKAHMAQVTGTNQKSASQKFIPNSNVHLSKII